MCFISECGGPGFNLTYNKAETSVPATLEKLSGMYLGQFNNGFYPALVIDKAGGVALDFDKFNASSFSRPLSTALNGMKKIIPIDQSEGPKNIYLIKDKENDGSTLGYATIEYEGQTQYLNIIFLSNSGEYTVARLQKSGESRAAAAIEREREISNYLEYQAKKHLQGLLKNRLFE